ncbi:hypothetical protein PTKIN_Ptkin03bG0116000 [Pterospermum kingtungense]
MRIRKRFPFFPVIPSSVDSSKEVPSPSQGEGKEMSSIPAPALGTPRQAPEKVHNDWQSIMTEAHRMLGCSSCNFNHRTIRPCGREEHSSYNPVNNGETVSETQLTNERNKKTRLEQENPSQKMVLQQRCGNSGKQIFDLFCNSQMKGNCSGTSILNTKKAAVSSSFSKGDGKGMFVGNSKDGKAETTLKSGGSISEEERAEIMSMMEAADALSSMEAGIYRCACANSSSRLKLKDKAEEEEHYSSASPVRKKAKKIRSLTSIYDDIRSLLPLSSKLDQTEESTDQ